MSTTPAAGQHLVDTQAAAIAVDRRPATIRSWIHRGRLTPHGKDRAGRTLVDLAEVYRTAAGGQNRDTRNDPHVYQK